MCIIVIKVNKTNINTSKNTCSRPNIDKQSSIECIVESGCTKHYIQKDNRLQEKPSDETLEVILPNGQTMSSTSSTQLNIPCSSKHGKQAHIFNKLTSGNLLSVEQLCDDGYQVTFTKDQVHFNKNNDVQFTGKRQHINGMWTVTFP